MDNYAIAAQLDLLSKLMDIHGENSFRSKSFAIAAFTLEKLELPAADMTEAQLSKTKNIGDSAAKKIIELVNTGSIKALDDILAKTPQGVVDMLAIKGLGPKKIHTLWKQLQIESIEDLQTACQAKRIAAVKGFGEKTEQKILESIKFRQQNKGRYLYAQVEDFALALTEKLKARFGEDAIVLTGDMRRQQEIVEKLEWVATASAADLKKFLESGDTRMVHQDDNSVSFEMETGLTLQFHLATLSNFGSRLLSTSASPEFLEALQLRGEFASEEAAFEKLSLPFIPPFYRESATNLENAGHIAFDKLVQTGDIKGLIHCHSDWSDGAYTIEEMAEALIAAGFEYMVISDHSKSAYYANGLDEKRIAQQHQLIDTLNKKFTPFKIFKGIECDILGDGSLDYSDDVLSTFDVVITSVHSNLDMGQEKAMQRLMGAIEHPQTRILGHMTGRLLLKRNGYPVDHKAVIDACAANNVVIEINSNPRRLDMDWRWIEYARDRGVMLSINPDAHSIEEFSMIKYGVLVAQKGGLQAAQNLSSMSLKQFEKFLAAK